MVLGAGSSDPLPREVEVALHHLVPPSGQQPMPAAVGRSISSVVAGCGEIDATLVAVAGALRVFDTSASSGMGNYGLIGLPVAAGFRAIASAASQYVDQQTGMKLNAWIAFVNSCTREFDAYARQLDRASTEMQTAAQPGVDGSRSGGTALLGVLTDVREETRTWKQGLGQVQQLGTVVDAILRAVENATRGKEGDPAPERPDRAVSEEPTPPVEPANEAPGQAAADRRPARARLGLGTALSASRAFEWATEVGERAAQQAAGAGAGERSAAPPSAGLRGLLASPVAGMTEWAAKPFLDLKERIGRLPSQVSVLSTDVELLMVMLDLYVASLFTDLDEEPAGSTMLDARVAALVWLPELARDVEDARTRASTLRARIDRLDAARATGQVGDRAWRIVSDEYRSESAQVESRLRELESALPPWREHGPGLIGACDSWVRAELDVCEARRIAEQAVAADDRLNLLRREAARLTTSHQILQSL